MSARGGAVVRLLGQRITWTTAEGGERSGMVWSAGPVERTAWVIPDDREPGEGRAVCVTLRKAGHLASDQDRHRSSNTKQADALASLRLRWPLGPPRTGQDKNGIWFEKHGYGYDLERGL